MKNVLTLVLIALTAAIGCRAQIPPSTPPAVALNWTASPNCTTTAPCVYAVSRATVTSGSSCPSTAGTSYTLIGKTAANATSFTDTTPTGLVCYIAQAQTVSTPVQTSIPSAASNGGVALAVPILPLAPGAPNAAATASVPKPSEGILASWPHQQLEPIYLTAVVRR